jgi:hypothetical protein
MTGAFDERRRSLWEHPWAPFILPLLFAVAGAGGVALTWAVPGGASDAERRLCDRAVDALLHSKDLVEVERAGIIIREVNCGIGRRLSEDEK